MDGKEIIKTTAIYHGFVKREVFRKDYKNNEYKYGNEDSRDYILLANLFHDVDRAIIEMIDLGLFVVNVVEVGPSTDIPMMRIENIFLNKFEYNKFVRKSDWDMYSEIRKKKLSYTGFKSMFSIDKRKSLFDLLILYGIVEIQKEEQIPMKFTSTRGDDDEDDCHCG